MRPRCGSGLTNIELWGWLKLENPVVFSATPSVVVARIDDVPVLLPPDQQRLVDMLWEAQLSEHPSWFRGEVFTIEEIRQTVDRIEFGLARTDYAHYLATVKGFIDPQFACQVLYGAAILRTQDNHLVFGEMGPETTYAGRLQGIGGGISDKDIENHHVNLQRGVLRELYEETGVDTAELVPRWLKMGGPYHFVVVVYEARLASDLATLNRKYAQFVKQLESAGETPEFRELVSLPATREAVRGFVSGDSRPRVDYLDGVLARMLVETGGRD